ncbi:hypothetical protein DEA8626_00322 [Defluviimonas aquaemixtae]|uniref:DUF3726 domain-containing protein n=1 Tax=Albidovulum aquaemixtae TaxID=1542388 RepID=A0A2R8B2I5_9RHOB|nr:DUF3726 domain-containing protein [Defluviimonas aquaemixtae]SPH16808.1 hypothetical protein DEA8626_00322 [Defluviimonas aquaemixtae]
MSALPNDPTRAGAPVAGAAVLSLPEVEALCLKAARGAGMSWGLAEEAGHAAAWLAAQGLPGPELMLRLLEASRGREWSDRSPALGALRWRAQNGLALLPVATGAAFADLAGPLPLRIERLAYPGLVLPSIAIAAGVRGHAIRLEWSSGSVAVTAEALDDAEAAQGLCDTAEANVSLQAAETLVDPAERRPGHSISRAVWQALDHFALLTTVPATETSRADAGAGSSDND